MFASTILTVPVLFASLLQPSATRDCDVGRFGDPARDERTLASFSMAVEAYAALHRRLEWAVPPEWMIADREHSAFTAAQLAAVLRDARPDARTGDFFTPAVAEVFRLRIRAGLREDGYDLSPRAFADDEEGDGDVVRLAVNRPLPWGVTGATWPAALRSLPVLPPELEYRFFGQRLVLLDLHAALVIDVLELAETTVAAPTGSVEHDEQARFHDAKE